MSDYPTDSDLERVKAWDANDCHGLFLFIRSVWHWPDFATMEGGMLRLATGGWSGNEDIIGAMHDNTIVWLMCWQSSHRGGLHWFKDWKEPRP